MRRADLVTAAVIAAAMALHLRFCLLDERPPSDLGQYYTSFRNVLLDWSQGAIDWRVVDTPYSLLLATIGRVIPPSIGWMEVIDGAWLLLLLVGTAVVARSVGGPIAGAGAAIAIVGFPQTHVLARTHWIHHPEAAALIGALAVGLAAPRWGVVAGALLFLGESIRQTGVPFGVPVGLVLLGVGWARGDRLALLPVVVGMIAGVAWHAPSLALYIARKAEDADQYAMSVGAPWRALVQDLGWPMLLWTVPLALAGVRRAPVVALCLAWILGGLAAVAIFHVGTDNFPIAAVGLAVLAGVGAARFSGRLLAAGVLAAAILHVPPLLRWEAVRELPPALRTWAAPGPINYLRIYWNPLTVEQILPAVDEACASAGTTDTARCIVLASRGLFNPSWEDGGTFALFLAGRPRVSVLTPPTVWDDRGRAAGVTERVHALVDVRCATGVGPSTGGRFQAQNARLQTLLRTYGRTPLATYGDPNACTQTWYVLPPGGVLVQ